jgi:hypothetical protein
MMRKTLSMLASTVLAVLPGRAEVLQADLSIFGMD